MNKFNKNISLPNDWLQELKKTSSLDSLAKPIDFINYEISQNKKISPQPNQIFNAFKYCSFLSTKVVIFGQDPYFQKDLANGLAFSVNKDKPIPASLRNIFKEIKNDLGIVKDQKGCLKNWANQGVLLLNASLTVEISNPGSHSNIGWNNFIFDVIDILNNRGEIVFMLWGNNAKKYHNRINKKNNLVLMASHPSPLSAYKGFFGCNHFSKCNNYLINRNCKPIQW
tara:strand:+ start:1537 stop:2214 length:678 start_codon:yes stop_codon:yes gene_type:complete